MAQTLKQFKHHQEVLSDKRLNSGNYPQALTIVAEGDSWFDYPLKKDIVDYLRKDGYAIQCFAKAGDTLENMVFGSEYNKVANSPSGISHPGPLSLQKTLNAIRTYLPKIVLFSAGGNDVVGSEMITYLNHKHSQPKSLINKVIFDEKLLQMEVAIEFFIKSVHNTHRAAQILMDGYDYAKINGKGYSFIFNNIKGPWIQPAMGKKAITDTIDQTKIIRYLVDGFNEMLKGLDQKYPHFHHIDLRGMFPEAKDWDNEIHFKSPAYRKVANMYRQKIETVIGQDPLVEFKERIVV